MWPMNQPGNHLEKQNLSPPTKTYWIKICILTDSPWFICMFKFVMHCSRGLLLKPSLMQDQFFLNLSSTLVWYCYMWFGHSLLLMWLAFETYTDHVLGCCSNVNLLHKCLNTYFWFLFIMVTVCEPGGLWTTGTLSSPFLEHVLLMGMSLKTEKW